MDRHSPSTRPRIWWPSMCRASSKFSHARRSLDMWTAEQRNRLAIEHEILQREGFDQFSVYINRPTDTYYAAGTATANSGRRYYLHIPIPSGYPWERPPMYLTDPFPLRMADGTLVTSLGVSHQMHTLTPSSNGWVQI